MIGKRILKTPILILFFILWGCQVEPKTDFEPKEPIQTMTSPDPTHEINKIDIQATIVPPSQPQIYFSISQTEIQASHYGETSLPNSNPAWSHSGNSIAYTYLDHIWIVTENDLSKPQKICEISPYHGSLSNLVWSPDDKQIAIASEKLCSNGEECIARTAILRCDIESGTVSTFDGLEENIQGFFDWYEESLILVKNSKLVIYNIKDRTEKELNLPGINLNYLLRTIHFVDNAHIVYMRDDDIVIQVININNLETVEYINKNTVENINLLNNGNEFSASLSPNGKHIVWLSRNSKYDDRNLMFYDMEHNLFVPLLDEIKTTNNPETITITSLPSWNSDSNKLVFLKDGFIWIITVHIQ